MCEHPANLSGPCKIADSFFAIAGKSFTIFLRCWRSAMRRSKILTEVQLKSVYLVCPASWSMVSFRALRSLPEDRRCKTFTHIPIISLLYHRFQFANDDTNDDYNLDIHLCFMPACR